MTVLIGGLIYSILKNLFIASSQILFVSHEKGKNIESFKKEIRKTLKEKFNDNDQT